MCGFQTVLVLCLLMATAYARPGIPGIKGKRPHGPTAAATDVFDNTYSDDPGKWQSSPTTTTIADGTVSSKHNATVDASANAFVDGENIGKAISGATKTANANPIVGSGDLGRSRHHDRATEYNTAAANHHHGIPALYYEVPTTGDGSFENKDNSLSVSVGNTKSGDLCHSGESKCQILKNKPSVSNSRSTYNEHPDLSARSPQPPPKLDEARGGKTANPGSEPCTFGNSNCPEIQSGDKITDHSNQEHVDVNPGSGPCTSKKAKCSGNQSDYYGTSRDDLATTNPFLNGQIDLSDIHKAVKSREGSRSPGKQPNPFFYPHSQYPPTLTHHSESPSGRDREVGDSDQDFKDKPNASNPLNPFLNSHNQHPPKSTGNPHNSGNPDGSNDTGSSDTRGLKSNPLNPLNPFLYPHSQQPSILIDDTHHSKNPNGLAKTGPLNIEYPKIQTNPSSPVDPDFYPDSLHPSSATGDSHNPVNTIANDTTGPFNTRYPKIQTNPLNSVHPDFDPHSLHPLTITNDSQRSENPSGSDEVQPSDELHKGMPNNPSNPFLNPNSKIPLPSSRDYEQSENPNTSDEAVSTDQRHKGKPDNSVNPLKNPHNRYSSTPTGGTHHLENPTGSDTPAQSSTRNFHNHRRHEDTETSSPGPCNHNKCLDADNKGQRSETERFGNDITASTPSYKVKTCQPGVKCGSVRRPHNSKVIEHDVSDDGIKASAVASASSSAYSKASAAAISSAGGGNSAHARSEAYSSANSAGASNSWASSSASSSASACASSTS